MRTVYTFDTTHHALWAEEIAVETGVPCEIVPAPPEANARCNLALEVLPEDAATLEAALRAHDIPVRIYEN
ncbi:MAG TPA: DUF3343 domain-containing protein [Longimicrobiaceae bacterium]